MYNDTKHEVIIILICLSVIISIAVCYKLSSYIGGWAALVGTLLGFALLSVCMFLQERYTEPIQKSSYEKLKDLYGEEMAREIALMKRIESEKRGSEEKKNDS